jgi:GDPmannose 4,6-dehydratase
MTRTLIYGHTGQDGRILWRQLIERGHSLIGISRSGISYHGVTNRGNSLVLDSDTVTSLLNEFKPHQVYYLAACHHSSQDRIVDDSGIWCESWQTHVYLFESLLQKLKKLVPRSKVFYASSSRIFGYSTSSPQRESTPWAPACIYGTTKASGMLVAGFYRRTYSMHVSCGILYNHESPLRGNQFVSQKIINGLISITKGESNILEIGNVDARVDWGYAPDYTRAMRMILALKEPEDMIIATGTTHSVHDFINNVAKKLGLKTEDFVVDESSQTLQLYPQQLRGDATLLRKQTGWVPTVTFEEMIDIMVKAKTVNQC